VLTVQVTPRGAARARSGHPWIARADVAGERVPEGDVDEVVVLDERRRPLGCAFFVPPPAPIALRMYHHGGDAVPFAALWPRRLDEAIARRGAERTCRLVHAEGDRLPALFVDRYEDVAVLQTAARALDRLEGEVARALAERLRLRLVVARDDGSVRDLEGLARRKGVLIGGGPTRVEVREGRARLEIDVLEDKKTGGFLDQRENHLRTGELARPGARALDAFTYHGGFALALAARGAEVVALDEDPAAVERARRNAALSQLDNLEARQADAFQELRRFEREGRRFDVVVVDPPALAKRRGPGGGAKRSPVIDTALRAYKELNLRALRITAEGGFLVTCSCSGKVTRALFEEMLVDAAADAGRQAAILERRGAAADHPVLLGVPETEYLKCFVLRVY
jgi:23S rRNA (cytosine1962-C5)-methyltransferase